MFHLTPQEKSALSWVLTVFLLGSTVHWALNANARPVQWANAVAQKPKTQPPDINRATAQELDKVPGIGSKTAQNIVAYRTKNGPFFSLQGLRKVKGITKKNFPKIERYYRQEEK